MSLIELVKNYSLTFNRLPSPKSKDPELRELGKWCSKQRELYRAGRLTTGEQELLMTIPNWYWPKNKHHKEYNFFSKYNQLKENNLCKLDKNLKNWSFKQKKKYHKGTLRIAFVLYLEELPGWCWNLPIWYQKIKGFHTGSDKKVTFSE